LTAGEPTQSGNIYPEEVLLKMAIRFTQKPPIYIQEMNEVERKAKKIPMADVWEEKIMGMVTKGEIKNKDLIFHATCLSNKHGRKLQEIIKSVGIENLDFLPVGYGTVGDKKIINSNYKLNFVAVEPKGK